MDNSTKNQAGNVAAKAMQEKLHNNKILRDVRREMGKFALDTTKVNLSLHRGTLLIMGRFAPLREKESLFDNELKAMTRSLTDLPEINRVVFQ